MTPKKILMPVDMSKNCMSALEMASRLAEEKEATLVFLHVEPTSFSEDAFYDPDAQAKRLEQIRERLKQLRPTSDNVKYDFEIVEGNPGPQIVHATYGAEVCVMSTHGRSGFFRMLMGSVAEYVMRHAHCPVVLVKGFETTPEDDLEPEEKGCFVTEVMHQVAPVHAEDSIAEVLAQLKKAGESGAPVVDLNKQCIGILTSSDIEAYHELQRRYDAGDETVVKEMFRTDDYGQYRCENADFDTVSRHMTQEVVSVRNDDRIAKAKELFAANDSIHHLVVLDSDDRPVGIIDAENIPKDSCSIK